MTTKDYHASNNRLKVRQLLLSRIEVIRARECGLASSACRLFAVLFISLMISAEPAVAGDGEHPGSSPVIHSAAEIDYPPFSLVDDTGTAGGFSVELMRAALAAMGRDVTFRTGEWAEVRGLLERGEIDALPLVGRTPEREALFDFTVPYMTLHGAIVVRTGESNVHDLVDLRGRRVAVMKGDNAEEFLKREDRGLDIHTTPTFEIALQELADGRYDAVVAQRLVALRLIQKTGLTSLRVLDQPIADFNQDFCFAVQEGDRDTLALLNEGLAIVVADGTSRHLHAKWFAAMQLPTARPLVIGGDRNFPPYEFLDANANPAGFNVDLTRALARKMGLNIEIRLGHWPERMAALREGRIDVLQGMFYSSIRDLDYDFSPAHTVSHLVAVVRKGEKPAPETLEELQGKRIVVERDDIMHDFALEHGLAGQLTVVDDQEEALQRLSEGQYDCALTSRITALYLIEKNGWNNLIPARKSLLTADYGYAVAKGQKALLSQFSEGLKALENTGEYRSIHDKWLGVYQEKNTSFATMLRYSAFVLVPLLVILMGSFVWSWTLRRQVAEKTKALHESLDQFKYVFDAANVGKSMTMIDGKIHTNKAFADFLGYSLDELQNKRWQDITPAEDIPDIEKILLSLTSGEKDAIRFEKRYLHKNGAILWADVNAAIRRDAAGTPLYFMTTVVDITARKHSEATQKNLQGQLMQAQKMESIGRLAGGIAHDYNNMLSVIIGFTEFAMEKAGKNDLVREDLEEVLNAARRSSDITRQLLAFARRQTINPFAIELNDTVEAMLKMLRRLIGEDIDLSWRPGPGNMSVLIDPSQLDQLLVNFCINARDAINGVGKLTIETDIVRFDEEYCRTHVGFIPGNFVMLAVSDNGCGMDKETIENIFEPFFTTKSLGEGTGLGLSTVYGIVKQNGGFINVYSEPGQGTTFKIYLPLLDRPEEKMEIPRKASVPGGRGETVMIVEDEASILKLAKRILESSGYTVLSASTPSEAEGLAETYGGDIDLLITDVVMPEMNGRALAEIFNIHHPDMKTIFMSGYTANVIAHHGVLDKGVNFIQKPFSANSFTSTVRDVLDR